MGSKRKTAESSEGRAGAHISGHIGVGDEELTGSACPTSAIPADVPAYLRRGSFLPHEDQAAYYALLESVCETYSVKNCLSFIFAKQLTDAIWRGLRIQHLTDAFLSLTTFQQVETVILKTLDPAERQLAVIIAWRWRQREEGSREAVHRHLANAGVGPEALSAGAFVGSLDRQMQLDALAHSQMLNQSEAMRFLSDLARLAGPTSGAKPQPADEAEVPDSNKLSGSSARPGPEAVPDKER